MNSSTTDAPRKRGRGFWLWQVVPPLLMLLLMLTDSGPGFYFGLLPLLLVALACVLSIVLRIGFLLFRRGDWRRLLRPVLALAIFVAAMAYVQWSLVQVREVANDEAVRIQAECVRVGKCPGALTIGRGEDGFRRYIGAPSTHLIWPILYRPGDDGFDLYLNEMIDTSQHWSGGPQAELQRESLIDGQSVDLDD